jgi:hypothetical protein
MREKIAPGDYIDPISHDGVHDSLTYLAAPPFFYEILHREIARANREGSPLMLFRFTLHCQATGLVHSQYESSIINFARVKKREGINFVNRLFNMWGTQDFAITHSFAQYRTQDSLLDFLNELDSAESA